VNLKRRPVPTWAVVGICLFLYLVLVSGMTIRDMISTLPLLMSGLTHIKG